VLRLQLGHSLLDLFRGLRLRQSVLQLTALLPVLRGLGAEILDLLLQLVNRPVLFGIVLGVLVVGLLLVGVDLGGVLVGGVLSVVLSRLLGLLVGLSRLGFSALLHSFAGLGNGVRHVGVPPGLT